MLLVIFLNMVSLGRKRDVGVLTSGCAKFALVRLVVNVALLTVLTIITTPGCLLVGARTGMSDLRGITATVGDKLRLICSRTTVRKHRINSGVVVVRNMPIPLCFKMPSISKSSSVFVVGRRLGT